MTRGPGIGVGRSCAPTLDPQIDRLWIGEENKL